MIIAKFNMILKPTAEALLRALVSHFHIQTLLLCTNLDEDHILEEMSRTDLREDVYDLMFLHKRDLESVTMSYDWSEESSMIFCNMDDLHVDNSDIFTETRPLLWVIPKEAFDDMLPDLTLTFDANVILMSALNDHEVKLEEAYSANSQMFIEQIDTYNVTEGEPMESMCFIC